MLDIDMDSIVSQLKNKVSYRLEQTLQGAVNDPEANQYAKEKAELKSSLGTGDEMEEIPANLPPVEKMLKKMKRIAIRIKDRMINLFITFIIPLILAMFVANESVMYPAPVRIIYFVFTFVLCYLNKAAVVLLGIIYFGRFAYDYYVNKIEKRGVPLIVPPILGILPVKVLDPNATPSFFKDLINYPLIYPRNERGKDNLLVIMNDYLESLKKSFTYLDNVKSMPMFVEKLKKIDENMEQLHKPNPEPAEKKENQESFDAKLPPTIAEQREKNGLPPLNVSEVEENKKRPVPLTIAEQREKNGLPPMNESVQENNTQPLPPTVSKMETTPNNSALPPNYNGKEQTVSSNSSLPPNYNGKEQTVSSNSSLPPNYNGKEQTVSSNSSLPPNYNGKEQTVSEPPAYHSAINKGNQSQPKTPKQ